MRSRPLLAVALAASLVLGSCGDDDGDASPATTEATTTTSAPTTTTTEAPTTVTVTLLDPGAEPRQPLRYRFREGTTDAITQRNEITLVQEIAGQRQEIAAPITEVDVDYVAEDVSGDRFTAVGAYAETRVEGGDPAVVAETERLLAQLAGAELRTVSTTRGEIVESSVTGVEDTGNPVFDQLQATLVDQASMLAFPFPEEAVGVGARWEVSSALELGGLPIEARYVVTITGLDGDRVDADLEATLTFVPGPVRVQGTAAEVIDGELDGTGTIAWDLAGGLVPRVALETSGTATIEVQGTRLVQRQTQRSSLTTR